MQFTGVTGEAKVPGRAQDSLAKPPGRAEKKRRS